MVCCCVFCAGHGACSNILSLILSITFSFHIFGAISPKWYCDGDGCEPRGLYYSCEDGDCRNDVSDAGILTAVLMVLCSNLLLVIAFCIVVHCTSYKHEDLGPFMAFIVGGWYLIQELITTVILIVIRAKYDTLGWSAYCFTVPGIILMGVVILMLIYQLCWPDRAVSPK